ncbi:MAG: glycosyltransferase, partial [Kovacikia sp.]
MISLVTTVLNDQEGCVLFFAQMEAQTLLPNEIVIVDGGSKDGTWEFLQNYQPKQSYPLRVIQEAGCNVARGRNLAIARAQHPIIVSADIGCIWDRRWLEELAQPLLSNPQLDAVMGSWKVRQEDLKSDWARVEYALLNEPEFIATPKSHASSRAIAYRKSLWEKIGGYPEDLTLAADDMVFALLLHQKTDRVDCAPIPRCYWGRPTGLKSFCKEARRNFRGAGEAGIWFNHGLLVGG